MERVDLIQQGVGLAEALEDDEERHRAAELEWALTKMERAITRWETATQQINQAFELMGEATEHLLNLAEDNALGSAAHGRVSALAKLMRNKILCHERAVKAAAAKQLYGRKPVGRVVRGG
jgi:hypothetical protein